MEPAGLPCWFESGAQVQDVPPPEVMQRQEELVPAEETTRGEAAPAGSGWTGAVHTNLWCSGLIWKTFRAFFCCAVSPLALLLLLLVFCFLGLA